jgi:hypothetical protein
VVEEMIAAYGDEEDSLMDLPEYQILVDALASAGEILQVNLMDYAATEVATIPQAIDLSPADLDPLPVYRVAVLAALYDSENQVSLIALVYDNEDDAQRAAEEVRDRIATFDPNDAFEELAVKIDDPTVYTDDSGLAVAIAALRYPYPEQSETDLTNSNGLLYRLWMNAVYRREFYPISGGITQ